MLNCKLISYNWDLELKEILDNLQLLLLSSFWNFFIYLRNITGDNLGVYILNPLSARPQQRSMSSSSFLVPSDLYWNDTEVVYFLSFFLPSVNPFLASSLPPPLSLSPPSLPSRSLPLLPSESLSLTQVLVSGPKGNYTVRDYKKFFEDIDFEDGYQMRKVS